MKSVEELEKEIERVSFGTVDTHYQSRANAFLKIIAGIQIEILKEIRSFRQTWQQQEQQVKGRHK